MECVRCMPVTTTTTLRRSVGTTTVASNIVIQNECFLESSRGREGRRGRRRGRERSPMAAMRFPFLSTSLQQQESTPPFRTRPFFPSSKSRSRKFPVSCSVSNANTSPGAEPQKPEIEVEFIGPKQEADGSYPVQKVTAVSGDKLLRNIMLDNKIELYAAYGKVMNCGGGGSCGTCIVEVLEGIDLLNERTNTELRYLKKNPESWRLTCQTIVGNKENSGKVVVQRLPQWKK
ncbi:hypothetical protein H6P81_003883 [Aristolochia fimbriata]|uniref:2Fe-2S ferredoxin-type domain-containing protein n=1 Tax=Aristolochia fimbriata TaxID=158543 RepID=A0AAV7FDV4_ARIFI|nr:hypothetical protein H6P81_003883 [Aristolochia fimbriata]